MTNSEAIRIIGFLKETIDFDLLIGYATALDMAIASLKRDEIGLTETIKQIHDGVYEEAYEKGRKDAIDEFVEMLTNDWGLDIILVQSNKGKLKSFIVSNAEQLKEKKNDWNYER